MLISEKIKLSGLYINYFPLEKKGNDLQHVHSMMFCRDKTRFAILKKENFIIELYTDASFL